MEYTPYQQQQPDLNNTIVMEKVVHIDAPKPDPIVKTNVVKVAQPPKVVQ